MQINIKNISIASIKGENENVVLNSRLRKQDASGADVQKSSELMARLQETMKKSQANVNTATADQAQFTASAGTLPDVNVGTGDYRRSQVLTQNGVAPLGQSKPQQSLLMLGRTIDIKG